MENIRLTYHKNVFEFLPTCTVYDLGDSLLLEIGWFYWTLEIDM